MDALFFATDRDMIFYILLQTNGGLLRIVFFCYMNMLEMLHKLYCMSQVFTDPRRNATKRCHIF
jgi:hypothetical protein